MTDGEHLRIGDVARRAGTSIRTVRYYEEIGLVQPWTRSAGGFRLYDEEAVRRLRVIRGLQALGFPLNQIREMLRTGHAEHLSARRSPALLALLAREHALAEQKIDEYQRLREEIRQAISLAEQCQHCETGRCEVCALERPDPAGLPFPLLAPREMVREETVRSDRGQTALVLDNRGYPCVTGLARVRRAMQCIVPGEIVEVLSDDAATVREYRLWAARTGHQVVEAGDCTAFPRAVRLRRWR